MPGCCFRRNDERTEGMIRNIVFDMGNVLLKFDPERFMTREGIEEPADRLLLRREMFLSLEWAQMDLGVLTEDTAAPRILSRLPEHLRPAADRLLRSWAFPREQIPGMEDLVRRLKEAGYGIYLLSNASVLQHEYWPRMPVSRYFDGSLISCDVGMVKPVPEIYRLLTEKYGLKGEECVFIDDASLNVAGAVSCGWKGIVFHGDAEETERKLREMGVEIGI